MSGDGGIPEIDIVMCNHGMTIVIAEYKGQKCGLGRLIYINDDNVELSGIYVFEAFRKKGVAHKIVRFLLDGIAGRQLTVWCIPFVYLKHLYESFGLKSATVNMKAPLAITKKLDWCHKNYDAEVVLLYKHI